MAGPCRSFSGTFAKMKDGHMMHYTDTGGNLPALILVHGIADFGTKQFHEIGHVDALKDTCRVIVPDNRGHGFSQAEPKTCTFSHVVSDLNELITELGLEKDGYVLYGWSMGWDIVLTYIKTHGVPKGLKGLINEDHIPKFSPGKGEVGDYEWLGLMGPAGAMGSVQLMWRDRFAMGAGFKSFSYGPEENWSKNNAEFHFARMNTHLAACPAESMISYFCEMVGTYDCTAVLPKIKDAGVPSLHLSGVYGFQEADIRKQAEIMGNAEVIRYALSGHAPSLCETEKVQTDMKAFMKKVLA